MEGVREYAEGFPSSWPTIRQMDDMSCEHSNQSSNDEVRIDLWDLIAWLKIGPPNTVFKKVCGIAGT